MLTQERYSSILDILQKKSIVTVTELTDLLGASESTIRRDLISLDEMGKLKKVHGGATLLDQEYITLEADVPTKSLLNVEEKAAIARYAAGTIQDDDFVYIDAGTSTEHLIEYLGNTRTIFVTNGIVHAKKLIARGLKTYIIGGQVKPVTEAIIGTEAVNNMKKYNFTKSFLGTNGIHENFGFTTVDVEEAMVKMEAVNRSYMAFVLADHTKFDKVTAVTFAGIEKACIITDRLEKPKYKDITVVKEVMK